MCAENNRALFYHFCFEELTRLLFVCVGFSGPTWPHKEGSKTPGPGPSGMASLPPLSTVTAPPSWLSTTTTPGPSFDTSDIPTTITARPGQTVFLPCRVKNRGDNVVSVTAL